MAVSETDMRIEDLQKRLTVAENNITNLFAQLKDIKKLLVDARIGSG